MPLQVEEAAKPFGLQGKLYRLAHGSESYYDKLVAETWAMGCGTGVLRNVAYGLSTHPPERWDEIKQWLVSLGGMYQPKRFLWVTTEEFFSGRPKGEHYKGCFPLIHKDSELVSTYENRSHASRPNLLFMLDLGK